MTAERTFVRTLLGLALTCVLMTGGCASLTGAITPVAGAAPQPYDLASAEDRRLQDFERSHSECDLWTDWRKICSHMGPNGETTCRTDPSYPAKASEPFCADYVRPLNDTLPQALSRARFCAKFNDQIPGQVQPQGAHFCARYEVNRPFNGARISQLQTPDCLEWRSWLKPLSENPVECASDPANKDVLPACSSLSIRRLRPAVAYECIKWLPGAKCKWPVAGRLHEWVDSGISLLIPPPPQTIRPVWGVYCFR